VSVGRPELQFGVARGAKTDQVRLPARNDIERRDDLGVTAIESFRKPEHRGQRAHRAPEAAFEEPVTLVAFLRRRLTMIARQERDDFDLLRIEAAQLAVLDQVVRMTMMALVADVDAGVVKERAIFEPLTFAIAELVHCARLIEDRQRELRHVARVRR
jgi:hypothetical protein